MKSLELCNLEGVWALCPDVCVSLQASGHDGGGRQHDGVERQQLHRRVGARLGPRSPHPGSGGGAPAQPPRGGDAGPLHTELHGLPHAAAVLGGRVAVTGLG